MKEANRKKRKRKVRDLSNPATIPYFREVARELGRSVEWLRCARIAMGRTAGAVTAKEVNRWYLRGAGRGFQMTQIVDGQWQKPPCEHPLPSSVDKASKLLLMNGTQAALLRLQAGQHECTD